MTDNLNSLENSLIELINLLERAMKVIDQQKNLIEDLGSINKNYNEIIKLKDQTIDKQLQMLQLMELKLKDFGIELGESSIF
jgi:hypothetical protein